jgi:hypothetical protein
MLGPEIHAGSRNLFSFGPLGLEKGQALATGPDKQVGMCWVL